MAVSGISNSLAAVLQAFRPEAGVQEASREKAKESDGAVGATPKPTVNASGQTIGTIISTTA